MRQTTIRTPFHLCLHAVSGRTRTVKTCIHDYQCWHCAFDQWLDEMEDRQKAGDDVKISNDIEAIAA